MSELVINQFQRIAEVRRGFDEISWLYTLLNGEAFIAGSFAAWMVSSQENPYPPGDVDVFCTSGEVARRLWMTIRRMKTIRTWESSEIAYTVHFKRSSKMRSVQIIKPHPDWKAFPADILNSFDLDICRAVLLDERRIYCDDNAGGRVGKVLLIADPMRTLKRIMKYQQRGVTFADGEIYKCFEAWGKASEERKAQMHRDAHPELFQEVSSEGWNYEEDSYFRGE